MKTINYPDPRRAAFIAGAFAQTNLTEGCKLENPHASTSDCSDAFWLGAMAARMGLPTNTQLWKSRGYTWFMAGEKYLVEGAGIKKIS